MDILCLRAKLFSDKMSGKFFAGDTEQQEIELFLRDTPMQFSSHAERYSKEQVGLRKLKVEKLLSIYFLNENSDVSICIFPTCNLYFVLASILYGEKGSLERFRLMLVQGQVWSRRPRRVN